MNPIRKTQRQARAEIVSQLAKQAGCSDRTVRRHAGKVKNTGTRCGCGETWALTRTLYYKDAAYLVTVGICEHCGD